MIVLLIIIGLLTVLLWACWSSARSYYQNGRIKGMDEAVQQIVRGIGRHYEMAARSTPSGVSNAIAEIKALLNQRHPLKTQDVERHHLQISLLADAIGEACCSKGQAEGVEMMAPAEGYLRVDLSVIELLQLSRLAHLGFLHMMPNYRGLEVQRFSDELDAQEGARSIYTLERVIPLKERPFVDPAAHYIWREQLISDWWQPPTPKRAEYVKDLRSLVTPPLTTTSP
ncbi:hypothetical protein DNX69_11135 [Rhodopseudomonas palustris]|uniref:Uncharacterized protein n=1 Tax=Rhodopseudomonas palustris TaxID=1076 RepID=A0A323UK44_RHOPL|nr:hypothetical protein [Rhodopseudomonas palustris]PZA12513.1 hypothetical protein DNX69_11135 [Rhodopseudomonas palustris]